VIAMLRFIRLVSIALSLSLGNTAFAQNSLVDDPDLSPQQRKYLKQLKFDLDNRPINPNASEQHMTKVQGSLRRLLAANNKPSDDCTNTLAATLYNGLNNGQISTDTALLLSKQISKSLGAQSITYQNVNQFTKAIDPLVAQTTLSPTEKLKLYRDAIIILKTVPNYVPEARDF
jgi:hypothetical protein